MRSFNKAFVKTHDFFLEKEMTTASIFLPGEFRGQRNLVGYSPWSHKELNMTEVMQRACMQRDMMISY